MTRVYRQPVTRARALLTAALALAAIWAATAPDAHAAFTTSKCAGANITAEGASFQNRAHQVWGQNFANVFCAPLTPPGVAYTGSGSGAGRAAMVARTPTGARFAGTDEPLDSQTKAAIEAGDPAVTGDEGTVHQIPVAVGAVAPLVNWPDACDPATVPAENRIAGTTATNFTSRVGFTKAQWETIWQGGPQANTWGDIFPGMLGRAPATDADCRNKPITRVARFDVSGTTFAFKDFLGKIDPGTWPVPGDNNTLRWPNAQNGTANCPTGEPPFQNDPAQGRLITACANGGGALVDQLKLPANDGSVGYADLATARGRQLDITPCTAGAACTDGDLTNGERDDDMYWTQLPRGDQGTTTAAQFQDPAFFADGFLSGGQKGANCVATEYDNVPTSTLGDWASVSGTNSNLGFPICSLTYVLAWQDYSKPYSACTPGCDPIEEERKARTARDYLESAVSSSGQEALPGSDYASLPTTGENIRAIAQAGVLDIDFGTPSGGGGGGGGGGGDGGGGGGGGGGGTTPPPPAVEPSNVFSVPRTTVASGNGTATFTIRVPGAGRIVLTGRANIPGAGASRRIRIARVAQTVSRAGTYRLTLRPNRAARRVLRRRGQLRTRVTITYTPQGGAPRSSTRTVTLKLRKRGGRS
jgi:ABC-type phosphate transport system substrate-binding protein